MALAFTESGIHYPIFVMADFPSFRHSGRGMRRVGIGRLPSCRVDK